MEHYTIIRHKWQEQKDVEDNINSSKDYKHAHRKSNFFEQEFNSLDEAQMWIQSNMNYLEYNQQTKDYGIIYNSSKYLAFYGYN